VGCGARGVGCGVRGVGCGLWDVGCGVWGVGCGVWDVGFGVPGLGIRHIKREDTNATEEKKKRDKQPDPEWKSRISPLENPANDTESLGFGLHGAGCAYR